MSVNAPVTCVCVWGNPDELVLIYWMKVLRVFLFIKRRLRDVEKETVGIIESKQREGEAQGGFLLRTWIWRG